MFPLVLSPHVFDSPMDDLWRALSSSVIGRHVGSQSGNESMREAEISGNVCELRPNSSNLQREVEGKGWRGRGRDEGGMRDTRRKMEASERAVEKTLYAHFSLNIKTGEKREHNQTFTPNNHIKLYFTKMKTLY